MTLFTPCQTDSPPPVADRPVVFPSALEESLQAEQSPENTPQAAGQL